MCCGCTSTRARATWCSPRVIAGADGAVVVGATTGVPLELGGQKLGKAGASLVGLDKNGKATWATQVFTDGQGTVSSIAALGGGVVTAGTFTNGDLGQGAWQSRGSIDAWTAAYDKDGKLLWGLHLGDKSSDAGPVLAAHKGGVVAAVQANNAYMIGDVAVTELATAGEGRVLFALDADGKLLWHAVDDKTKGTVGAIVSWGDAFAVSSTGSVIEKYDGAGKQLWSVSLYQQLRFAGGLTVDGDALVFAGTKQPNMKTPPFPMHARISSDGKAEAPKGIGTGLAYAMAVHARKAGDLLVGMRSGTGATFGGLKIPAYGHDDGVICAVPK